LRQVKKMMLKTARRQLEEQMTADQLQREKAVQHSQLDAISRLLLGSSTTDSVQSAVDDLAQTDMVAQQLRMYLE